MDLQFTGEIMQWRGPAPHHLPKDGAYVVPPKDVMRQAEGLDLGDVVLVADTPVTPPLIRSACRPPA